MHPRGFGRVSVFLQTGHWSQLDCSIKAKKKSFCDTTLRGLRTQNSIKNYIGEIDNRQKMHIAILLASKLGMVGNMKLLLILTGNLKFNHKGTKQSLKSRG